MNTRTGDPHAWVATDGGRAVALEARAREIMREAIDPSDGADLWAGQTLVVIRAQVLPLLRKAMRLQTAAAKLSRAEEAARARP